MKWLRRYPDEKEPTLKNFAKLVVELDQRQHAEVENRLRRLWA